MKRILEAIGLGLLILMVMALLAVTAPEIRTNKLERNPSNLNYHVYTIGEISRENRTEFYRTMQKSAITTKTSKDFKRFMLDKTSSDVIVLKLETPGGYASAMDEIVAIIKETDAVVIAHVDFYAASAGAIIMHAADARILTKEAMVLFDSVALDFRGYHGVYRMSLFLIPSNIGWAITLSNILTVEESIIIAKAPNESVILYGDEYRERSLQDPTHLTVVIGDK